jgi:hypothetical protein
MVARLEVTVRGFDARIIVTSLEGQDRHWTCFSLVES